MQDFNDHISVKVSSGCSFTITICLGICLFVYLLHIHSYILWSTVAEHSSSCLSFVTCMGEKVICMWCKNQKERDRRHRWNDDTEVTVEKLGRQSVEWIHLAQGGDHWWAFMNIVINLVITG